MGGPIVINVKMFVIIHHWNECYTIIMVLKLRCLIQYYHECMYYRKCGTPNVRATYVEVDIFIIIIIVPTNYSARPLKAWEAREAI